MRINLFTSKLAVLACFAPIGLAALPLNASTVSFSSLTAGQNHACVIAATQPNPRSSVVLEQDVMCWGNNEFGQLGNHSGIPMSSYADSVPRKVDGISGSVKQLSAGDGFTCALLTTGAVQCWGGDTYGVLGKTDWTVADPWPSYGNTPTPLTIPHFSVSVPATQISSGATHVCALQYDGYVLCWGDNRNLELGASASVEYSPTPLYVALPYPAISVSAGDGFSCAVLEPNSSAKFIALPQVWCWGSDDHAQLGDGQLTLQGNKKDPVQVTGLNLYTVAISAGDAGACAFDLNGQEQCWGDDDAGEIGNGVPNQTSTTPSPEFVSLGPVRMMANGSTRFANCSTMLSQSGVACWGLNSWALLGSTFNSADAYLPVANKLTNATEISIGLDFACAISTSDLLLGVNAQHVYCWGHNDYGQVGNGATTFSYWSSAVASPTEIL